MYYGLEKSHPKTLNFGLEKSHQLKSNTKAQIVRKPGSLNNNFKVQTTVNRASEQATIWPIFKWCSLCST